jgi:hypothetical protein
MINHDKLGHLEVSTSSENAKFPEKVASVEADSRGKRDLDFDWHQVARKILTIERGFGRNHGPV